MIKNLYLNIILGNTCNRNCPFCYSKSGVFYTENNLNILQKNLITIKDICIKNNINIIPTILGGGEISLVSDNKLLDTLKLVTSILQKKVSIVTNAARYSEVLINPVYVNEINISLHDLSFETIQGIIKYFENSKFLIKGITLVNPDLYCNLTIYALYKLAKYLDIIEVKPVEKTIYGNETKNFTYSNLVSFLKEIAFNPILGSKLKINKADFDSELLFLTDNQIKLLINNTEDKEELKAVNNLEFICDNRVRTGCAFCRDFTWCTDEHPNTRHNCSGTKLVNEFKKAITINPDSIWVNSDKNIFMNDLEIIYDSTQDLLINLQNYIYNESFYNKYLMIAKPVLVYLCLKIYLEMIGANLMFYNNILIKTIDTMKRNKSVNELISLAETMPTDFIRKEINKLFTQITEGKEITNKLLLYIFVSIGYDFGINII